jgi:hypothetical protein
MARRCMINKDCVLSDSIANVDPILSAFDSDWLCLVAVVSFRGAANKLLLEAQRCIIQRLRNQCIFCP